MTKLLAQGRNGSAVEGRDITGCPELRVSLDKSEDLSRCPESILRSRKEAEAQAMFVPGRPHFLSAWVLMGGGLLSG